jgi:cis-3-alkyl-4-acyloxetan-2-one decarboxylase
LSNVQFSLTLLLFVHSFYDYITVGVMSVAWRKLYPFQSHYMPLAAARMHYIEEGAGHPLLFVHGNPTWSFYWRNLVSAFASSNQCIGVDHIGCGLSDKPQTYNYTLAQHTENLCQFIETKNLHNITLLVHDWGGAIGLGAAVKLPERFRRIVLFNTAAFPPPFVPWRIAACRIPLFGQFAIRGLNLFARAALRMAVEHGERMTPEVCAGLLAPYDSWSNRVAVWRFVRDIPLTQQHETYATLQQLEASLSRVASLPIACVWGMRDWCFRPSCLRQFQQIFPKAESLELADAGHYVIEDAHERIIPWLQDFFERHAIS